MAQHALPFDVYIAIPASSAKSRRNLFAFASVFKQARIERMLGDDSKVRLALTFAMCYRRGVMSPWVAPDVARIIIRYILAPGPATIAVPLSATKRGE